VTKVRVEGQLRVVTFFNGTEVSERIIEVDDVGRRLAWTIEDGPYTHHSGSAQVFPAGASGTRFVWITDLLPDETAEPTTVMMRKGLATIKETLEAAG
jgi:hypothetical protein